MGAPKRSTKPISLKRSLASVFRAGGIGGPTKSSWIREMLLGASG